MAMGLLSAAPEAIGFILDKLVPAAGVASTATAAACADGDCGNEIQAVDRLLRYVGPDKIQETGQAMSGAFRDKNMSVFSEKLGATVEQVLTTFSRGTGQGAVYALDEAMVRQVQGVADIIRTQGMTGNPILDQAHFEIINTATKSVAQTIRDLAILIGGGG